MIERPAEDPIAELLETIQVESAESFRLGGRQFPVMVSTPARSPRPVPLGHPEGRDLQPEPFVTALTHALYRYVYSQPYDGVLPEETEEAARRRASTAGQGLSARPGPARPAFRSEHHQREMGAWVDHRPDSQQRPDPGSPRVPAPAGLAGAVSQQRRPWCPTARRLPDQPLLRQGIRRLAARLLLPLR